MDRTRVLITSAITLGFALFPSSPAAHAQDSPMAPGESPSSPAAANSWVVAPDSAAGVGFDFIPSAAEVEGLGFFTSHYEPPTTRDAWRLGVLYTPTTDEHPLEYWALVSGAEFGGAQFDLVDVSLWSVDIHEGLDHFIANEFGNVYHTTQAAWDRGSPTPYAMNGSGNPISLIGFDISPGVSLRAGVEYVISVSIVERYFLNGFGGVTKFPGNIPSAVQVSGQLADGWRFTSSVDTEFSGGVCTRLVSTVDICPDSEDPTDSDGDGVLDRCDGCPFDANKLDPGVCGCGTSDVDADGDGLLDCFPVILTRVVTRNPNCVGGGNAGALCARSCDCDSLNCATDLVPTSDVVVNPGGLVVVEFFAAHWSPAGERLQAFELRFGSATLSNGIGDPLRVLTGDLCCIADADCRVLDRSSCVGGLCDTSNTPSGGEVAAGFSIDSDRSDYVFQALTTLGPVTDISSAPVFIRWGDVVLSRQDSPVFSGQPRYLGTVVLQVPRTAAGTYVVLPSPETTVLLDATVPSEQIGPLSLLPATITVVEPTCGNGVCEPGEDEASCIVDCVPGAIPTASNWALLLMALSLLTVGRIFFRRKPEAGRLAG